MEITFSNSHTEEKQIVAVNGNPIGFIHYTWEGYEGFVGETKVTTGHKTSRAAHKEMVRQIGIIHRAKIRRDFTAQETTEPKPEGRSYAIACLNETGHYRWAGGRMRTFKTEGKAIDAAMKLAREMAGNTNGVTRVIVQQGPSQWLRKEIHSFPVMGTVK